VAAGGLVLSLVPGSVLLTNPRALFQFAGGQAGAGQFNNRQFNTQSNELANNSAASGQNNRNFQNRGVPGVGSLGTALGGSNAGTGQRTNNGLFTTLPIAMLMLMPLLSFFIIVPALTRKPRNAAPPLNASGLT
jgi:hypothetical protein